MAENFKLMTTEMDVSALVRRGERQDGGADNRYVASRKEGRLSREDVIGLIGEAKALGKFVDLYGRDLRELNLSDLDLTHANLRNAGLAGALLIGTRLVDAKLRNADLSGADLSFSNLKYADARYARFKGANLWHANLWNADVRYADLSGARNLEGALEVGSAVYFSTRVSEGQKGLIEAALRGTERLIT